MKRVGNVAILVCLLAPVPSIARADDLAGVNVFVCAAQNASFCAADGECLSGPPWMWNVPEFIVVDLDAKRLGTTKASGENRSTPIGNVQRKDGSIFLQGIEKGRAFSFQIDEATGAATVAVARDGIAVAVFGSCTPIAGAP